MWEGCILCAVLTSHMQTSVKTAVTMSSIVPVCLPNLSMGGSCTACQKSCDTCMVIKIRDRKAAHSSYDSLVLLLGIDHRHIIFTTLKTSVLEASNVWIFSSLSHCKRTLLSSLAACHLSHGPVAVQIPFIPNPFQHTQPCIFHFS